MKLLLDTHIFLWWITDAPELSENARKLIRERRNRLFWSAASSWEIAIKYASGKLPLPEQPNKFISKELAKNRISSLPISDAHAFEAGNLPLHHKDPFDRMLVAQARLEGLGLISDDPLLIQYDVKIIS